MADVHEQKEDRERQEAARRGAARQAWLIIGGLLVLAAPFGVSIFGMYRDFKDYATETLDSRQDPYPWMGEDYDVEACVDAGLDWIEACPGFEEFCRRGMPTYIARCMEQGDRAGWCAEHRQELMRTSYGYEACQTRVDAGELRATRNDAQRCAFAYRAAADWCLEHHPQSATAKRP